MTRARITLIALIGFGALFLIAGCKTFTKPRPIVNPTTQMTAPLDTISAEHKAATTQNAGTISDILSIDGLSKATAAINALAKSAYAHAQETASHLQRAEQATQSEHAVVVEVGQKNVEYQQQINDLTEANAKQAAKIAALEDCWVGPKAKRLAWFLGITGVVVAVVFGFIKGMTPGEPAVGAIYHIGMVFVTGGLSVAHAIGHGIGRLFMAGVHRFSAWWLARKAAVAVTPKPAAV
jgi:hypothetical protein